jgi:hypothetical protein
MQVLRQVQTQGCVTPTVLFNRTAHPRLTIVCQVKSRFLQFKGCALGAEPLKCCAVAFNVASGLVGLGAKICAAARNRAGPPYSGHRVLTLMI